MIDVGLIEGCGSEANRRLVEMRKKEKYNFSRGHK